MNVRYAKFTMQEVFARWWCGSPPVKTCPGLIEFGGGLCLNGERIVVFVLHHASVPLDMLSDSAYTFDTIGYIIRFNLYLLTPLRIQYLSHHSKSTCRLFNPLLAMNTKNSKFKCSTETIFTKIENEPPTHLQRTNNNLCMCPWIPMLLLLTDQSQYHFILFRTPSHTLCMILHHRRCLFSILTHSVRPTSFDYTWTDFERKTNVWFQNWKLSTGKHARRKRPKTRDEEWVRIRNAMTAWGMHSKASSSYSCIKLIQFDANENDSLEKEREREK